MADWFNISDAAVDPDAPITSELGYAFRDNPIAIAEGATGAPRVQYGAMGNPLIGVGVSVGTTPVAFTSIGPARQLLIQIAAATGGASRTQISTSVDNGTTWYGYENITGADWGSGVFSGAVAINLRTGSYNYHFSGGASTSQAGSGSFSAAPTANAIRIRGSSASVNQSVMVLRLGSGD